MSNTRLFHELSKQDYKISEDIPEIYKKLWEVFGVNWNEGNLVITFDGTIYKSFPEKMPDDLLMHELTHIRQQRLFSGTAADWYEKYINDADFRISMELEAYRVQYAYLLEHCNSHYRMKILDHMAKALSGSMYGSVMSFSEAYELIQQSHD